MDSSPCAVPTADNVVDLDSDGFQLQRGRCPSIDGVVEGIFGFILARQVVFLPGNTHIDVVREVGVEDIWNVSVGENLFDFIFSRVGRHFDWAMVLSGCDFVSVV